MTQQDDTPPEPGPPQDSAAGERYSVPGLARGLRLLECFGAGQPVWTAPELARHLQLPRSTVFRLLNTLEGAGYLHRSGSQYRLGLAVLRLGYDYVCNQPLAQLAEPLLQGLCRELGFTANLGLLDGAFVVYVQRVAPPGAFEGAVRTGSRLPAHAAVLGRALLQDMDGAALRQRFGGEPLAQFSERTPRSVTELLGLLEQDRARGCAVGEGFYEHGISSIAAPVRDGAGRISAALGIAIAFTDIAPERMAQWQARVQACAQALSGCLGAAGGGYPARDAAAVSPASPRHLSHGG